MKPFLINLLSINTFHFVEICFFISIVINLLSYFFGFYLIFYQKKQKTFFQTMKEGWTIKYFSINILNSSLFLTSFSIFWILIYLSMNYPKRSLNQAFELNIYLFVYLITSCITLIGYSIYVSNKNIVKYKELTSSLSILSVWNSVDSFMGQFKDNILFSTLTNTSLYIRKNIIQNKIKEEWITSILILTLEYSFKISILICVLWLNLIPNI
jgi:hypothetical protein